jgi:hypothetical protein
VKKRLGREWKGAQIGGQGAFFILGSDDRRMVVLGGADLVAAGGIAND